MRPFLLFYFFVSVLATVTVLPSNNSQDLSWSSPARFRLQASGSLNRLTLAPLTQSLVRLTDSEKEVPSAPPVLAPNLPRGARG